MAESLTREATPGLRVWESEGGHLDRGAVPGHPAGLTPRGGVRSVGDGRMSRWLPAGRLDELADDTAGHVELAGVPVCLARSAGTVHALLDECSHGKVQLSDGEVESGFVECWLHGSRFDLVTGRPTGPPATAPVQVYPVRIHGGVIEVDLPAACAQLPPEAAPPASPCALARPLSRQTTGSSP